jgi:hypothetical protein
MGKPMTSPAYCLQIISSGGMLPEVYFNGWLGYRKAEPEWQERTCEALKVNPYLRAGSNVLRVLVAPLRTPPAGTPPALQSDYLDVRLYKAEHGEQERIYLFTYRWYPELAPLAGDGLTEVVRHELHVDKAFGPWLWESARPYVAADRPDIERLMVELHDALARDANRFIDLLRVRLEEQARSTQRDPATVVEEQRRWIGGIASQAAWRVDPIDPKRLVMESSADGRLVEIRDHDGQPPLRASLGAVAFHFEITVSATGGRWTVVR